MPQKSSLLLRSLYCHILLPIPNSPTILPNKLKPEWGSHWECKLFTKFILLIFRIGLGSPESQDLQAAWLGYISQPHFLPLGLVVNHRMHLHCSHPFLMAGTSRWNQFVSIFQKMSTPKVTSDQYFGKWSCYTASLESMSAQKLLDHSIVWQQWEPWYSVTTVTAMVL